MISEKCELAPLILGYILGPMMEENLRRAMVLLRGDWTVLLTKSISAAFLIATIILFVILIAPKEARRSFRGGLAGWRLAFGVIGGSIFTTSG